MNLHEYQAKRVFAEYGVPVPQGRVASNASEAIAAAQALPGPVWVVKAQVHAGGRGKAGGVKLCRSAEEVGKAAKSMLGQRLVTPQTGAAGLPVGSGMVEGGCHSVLHVRLKRPGARWTVESAERMARARAVLCSDPAPVCSHPADRLAA